MCILGVTAIQVIIHITQLNVSSKGKSLSVSPTALCYPLLHACHVTGDKNNSCCMSKCKNKECALPGTLLFAFKACHLLVSANLDDPGTI